MGRQVSVRVCVCVRKEEGKRKGERREPEPLQQHQVELMPPNPIAKLA